MSSERRHFWIMLVVFLISASAFFLGTPRDLSHRMWSPIDTGDR